MKLLYIKDKIYLFIFRDKLGSMKIFLGGKRNAINKKKFKKNNCNIKRLKLTLFLERIKRKFLSGGEKKNWGVLHNFS